MTTHITVRAGKPAKHRGHEHHDDDKQPGGWAKHREPFIEKPISSLTANAGADRWAQRAKEHSFGAHAARSPEQITEMAKRRARITRR